MTGSDAVAATVLARAGVAVDDFAIVVEGVACEGVCAWAAARNSNAIKKRDDILSYFPRKDG